MKRETREYYFAAYHDLRAGYLTIEQANEYLKRFEEDEMYELCEGIKLAIEDYERR